MAAVLALSALAPLTAPAPADPNCGSQVTATANADSWIDRGSPSVNKGTDSILKVMSKGPSHDLRGLVRFQMPSMPAGCTVQTAKLRLYAGSFKEGRTVQALRVTGSWTDGGVNWHNQPATSGVAATVASGSGYREWDVKSQVKASYDAGAHHGFLIRDAAEGGDAEQQFHSREKGDNAPQLVLTFAPADSSAPDTTMDSGPSATTVNRSAQFTFSANQPDVTFECSLDEAAFSACSSPKDYTGLAIGDHRMRVRAMNWAGTPDASPASFNWTIAPDTTAPQTTIGPGTPPANTTSTSTTFSFSADEHEATFECSLDGAAFAACASPKQYTSLATGAHSFQVRAKDEAGNVDSTPASHFWAVEAPPAPTCSTSTVAAAADRDTWVLESSPTSNYGSDSVLKVDSKSGNGNARALVRFALPTIPAGCQVTSATLRLYSASYKEGRTLEAFRLGETFTEGGVNWASQPAAAGTAASAPSRSSAGYVEWSVTSHVQAMYLGTNTGFQIRDASENGPGLEQSFNSREKGADNPPQLIVETADAGELVSPGGPIDVTDPPAGQPADQVEEPPPAAAPSGFTVGVDDAAFHLAWDRAAWERLRYTRVRHDGIHSGDFAQHASYYKAQGVKVTYLRHNSADWTFLRDHWLWYGPSGTRVPGVIDRLEVGNEEAWAHRTSDPYAAGRTHGAAVRSLKEAAPSAQIVCQGDDGNRGTDAFFRGMRDANPSIAADCHEYSIHPYGPIYVDRMTRNRGYINNVLGDPTAKFAVTEWGLSVRLDQGCVNDNYGWNTCMSHAEAATRLRDFVTYVKGRGDTSFVTLFTGVDHPNATTNAADREYNFGLVSSHQTGEQEKGSYTRTARELIAADP
jgi:hypothetical protein